MKAPERRTGSQGVALSAIVPTLNEAANLPELLRRLQAALAGGGDRSNFEVIVVDDHSADGTAAVAERLGAELSIPLRVLRRTGPPSLALSVLEGARAARHGVVVVLDADLSHDPGQVLELAGAVLGGSCEVAVSSRYLPGSDIGSWPLRRRLLSCAGTLLGRLLTPLSDPLSGYFACRRDLLTGEVDLRPRGYKLLLELLARAPDLRVREFPTRFADRRRGESKLKLRQQLQFLSQVISLFSTRFHRLIPSHSLSRPRRALS